MIIIAVINQKGGVGKTTSVINLGYSFHLLGFKTLLVDLDPQANLTSGLGQSKTHAENVENFLLSETITPLQIYDQLFLIPGCEELISFEREVLTKEQREYYLKNALAGQQEFQLVLIDTPPALGILAINALVASNLVLIPVQAEYYALEGLTSLLKTIDFVKQNCNQTLTCLGIFLTMFDNRTILSRQIEQDLRKNLGDLLFEVKIPRSVRVAESPSHSKPILEYDPSNIAGISYLNLADKILQRIEKLDMELIIKKTG